MELMLQVLDELDDAVATLQLVWPDLLALAMTIAATLGMAAILL
jgi:hypothetical protein